MKSEFSGQNFEKYRNTKLHENPCIGSRVVPCGRTDMTKLLVAFRNFAPKRGSLVAIATVVQMSGYESVTADALQILINSRLNTDGCGHSV